MAVKTQLKVRWRRAKWTTCFGLL